MSPLAVSTKKEPTKSNSHKRFIHQNIKTYEYKKYFNNLIYYDNQLRQFVVAKHPPGSGLR